MPLSFSGDTFRAVYAAIADSEASARTIAREIAVEQTVEFPADLITREDILNGIVGRIADVSRTDDETFRIVIDYAAETAGTDFVQFQNVLLGNTGLKPGIRLLDFTVSATLAEALSGPRFGTRGLRALLCADERPLLATALKPMGLDNRELAGMAAAFSEGGIDIVKDDHGLADQPFTRFEDRAQRVAAAVQETNARCGTRCLYFSNLTGPSERLLERAHFAKEAGVGGFMVAPGLLGFDGMRTLSTAADLALPLMSHPAFLGPVALCPTSGISHGALFGKLNRAAGADIVVFPSFGGRFTFSKKECGDIVRGLTDDTLPFSRVLPSPAGGMTVARIRALLDFYGNDAGFLIGGDLHRGKTGLTDACRAFRESVMEGRERAFVFS